MRKSLCFCVLCFRKHRKDVIHEEKKKSMTKCILNRALDVHLNLLGNEAL